MHRGTRYALEAGDAVILLGLALIVIGVGLWSVPAAFITAGAACLVVGRALLHRPLAEDVLDGTVPPDGHDADSAEGRDE